MRAPLPRGLDGAKTSEASRPLAPGAGARAPCGRPPGRGGKTLSMPVGAAPGSWGDTGNSSPSGLVNTRHGRGSVPRPVRFLPPTPSGSLEISRAESGHGAPGGRTPGRVAPAPEAHARVGAYREPGSVTSGRGAGPRRRPAARDGDTPPARSAARPLCLQSRCEHRLRGR